MAADDIEFLKARLVIAEHVARGAVEAMNMLDELFEQCGFGSNHINAYRETSAEIVKIERVWAGYCESHAVPFGTESFKKTQNKK